MNRFVRRAIAIALACCSIAAPSSVFGQQPPAATPPPQEPAPVLVSAYDATFLHNLPTSGNLYTILENLELQLITDRFFGGGLEIGQAARVGGFLSSWTQTLFRVDGVSITDPSGNGEPFFLPELMLWNRIDVGTGLFRRDTNTPGIVVDLSPMAATDRWVTRAEGALSHGNFAGSAPGRGAPPIARLEGWDHGAVLTGGPLVRGRVNGLFGASLTRSSQFERAEAFGVDSSLASVFSHTIVTPTDRDTIRAFGWLQQRERPLRERIILNRPQATADEIGGHLQAVWHRAAGTPFRGHASFSARGHTPDFADAQTGITERLVDGPVTELASLSHRSAKQWSLGARWMPGLVWSGRIHRVEFGGDFTGSRLSSSDFFSGAVGELVHASPARVWIFTNPGTRSLRRATTLGAFVQDRMMLTTDLTFDAGLRYEWSGGSAEGAVNGISWQALLPHAILRWAPPHRTLAAFVGYSRSAHRLALDYLAYGDPAAPTAQVYRWNALAGGSLPLAARGALVANAGPGTGTGSPLSAIDPNLRRPTSDELVIGVEGKPHDSLLLRVTGVARWAHDLPAVVNTGAPASSYASFTVDDPGGDVLNPDDDQVLTVFNRLPSSFGQDRYVLTSPTREDATFAGLELGIQYKTGDFTLTGGGTASIGQSSVASRGYGPLENDETILGELLTNPNAGELARGRLFHDRAFTAKFAGVYEFQYGIRLGALIRYQDGQAFSRVIVFPGLNQGAEAVRAFENGRSRFMFIGTLDMRLQKTFTFNRRSVEGFIDVYNLPGRSNSVEEDIAEAPDVRVPIAVQPPRTIQLGLRVTF